MFPRFGRGHAWLRGRLLLGGGQSVLLRDKLPVAGDVVSIFLRVQGLHARQRRVRYLDCYQLVWCVLSERGIYATDADGDGGGASRWEYSVCHRNYGAICGGRQIVRVMVGTGADLAFLVSEEGNRLTLVSFRQSTSLPASPGSGTRGTTSFTTTTKGSPEVTGEGPRNSSPESTLSSNGLSKDGIAAVIVGVFFGVLTAGIAIWAAKRKDALRE